MLNEPRLVLERLCAERGEDFAITRDGQPVAKNCRGCLASSSAAEGAGFRCLQGSV